MQPSYAAVPKWPTQSSSILIQPLVATLDSSGIPFSSPAECSWIVAVVHEYIFVPTQSQSKNFLYTYMKCVFCILSLQRNLWAVGCSEGPRGATLGLAFWGRTTTPSINATYRVDICRPGIVFSSMTYFLSAKVEFGCLSTSCSAMTSPLQPNGLSFFLLYLTRPGQLTNRFLIGVMSRIKKESTGYKYVTMEHKIRNISIISSGL